MTESIETAAEKTADNIAAIVFASKFKEPQAVSIIYEFRNPEIAQRVQKICAGFQMMFYELGDKSKPFATRIVMDDILRTKFFIAMRCAKKKKQYRKLNRDIDFVCHGQEWKPPRGAEKDDWTLEQNIYMHTYGRHKV